MIDNRPVYVTGFQRTAGGIEIMYFETREQTRNAGMSRALIISDGVEEYNRIVESVCEDLEELIDIVLQDIRSPQKSLNPRERFAQRAAEEEAEEEDGDGEELDD